MKGSVAIETLAFPVWGNLDTIDKSSKRLQKYLLKSFREWLCKSAQYEKERIFPGEEMGIRYREGLAKMEQHLERRRQQLAGLTPQAEELEKIFFGAAAWYDDTQGEMSHSTD